MNIILSIRTKNYREKLQTDKSFTLEEQIKNKEFNIINKDHSDIPLKIDSQIIISPNNNIITTNDNIITLYNNNNNRNVNSIIPFGICKKINIFRQYLHRYNNNIDELKNRVTSALFHISLMSVFEILFYFFFIIKIERKLFLEKIINYNKEIKDFFYSHSNQEQLLLINNIITNNYNSSLITNLRNNYYNDLALQREIFNKLLHKAIYISLGITGIFLLFLLLTFRRLKLKWILFENILLFLLLGMYEYLFFNLIILHYSPVSDGEIKYLFVCNLLGLFNLNC